MYNKTQEHLVPPILHDKVRELLSEGGKLEIKENYAKQFEVIRDFCVAALEQYQNVVKARMLRETRKPRVYS